MPSPPRLSMPAGYVCSTFAKRLIFHAVPWLARATSIPFGADVGRSKPWITSPYGLNASYVSGRAGILGGLEADALAEEEEGASEWPKMRSRFSPPSGYQRNRDQGMDNHLPGNVLRRTCEKTCPAGTDRSTSNQCCLCDPKGFFATMRVH